MTHSPSVHVSNTGHRRPTPHADVGDTVDMNILQRIPLEAHGRVFVTLNPPFEPASVVNRFVFQHPVLDTKVSSRPNSQ